MNTPEKQQAVSVLILAKRRITVEEIAQQLDMSTHTAHHIIREVLKFSKVSCRWVPKMLMSEDKQNHLVISRKHLIGFTKKERPSCSEPSLAMKHGPSTMSLRQNSRAWNRSTHLLQ